MKQSGRVQLGQIQSALIQFGQVLYSLEGCIFGKVQSGRFFCKVQSGRVQLMDHPYTAFFYEKKPHCQWNDITYLLLLLWHMTGKTSDPCSFVSHVVRD